MTRLRSSFVMLLCAALATVLVACGGDDEVSADADPQAVLDRTFGSESAVESASIDAEFSIDAEGPEGGDLTITAGGAVQDTERETPDMDLRMEIQGTMADDDIDFSAGFVNVDQRVFLILQGEAYEMDPGLVDQMESEAGSARDEAEEDAGLFGDLDIPNLLTDLTNEGTVDVEGTETVQVSGTVDTTRAVAEIESLIGSAGALEGLGVDIPGLNELRELEETVGNITFDVYSGVDDGLLRRIEFSVPVDSDEQGTGTMEGSVTLTDVNEPQDIEAPANAGTFMDLIAAVSGGVLEDLGIDGFEDFGDFGFGFGGGGAGGAGADGGAAFDDSGDVPGTDEAFECLQEAYTPAEVLECQELLEY